MTRLAIIIGLICAIAVGGFIVGQRWDEARDTNAERDVIEDFQDATSDDRDRSTILERLRSLTD